MGIWRMYLQVLNKRPFVTQTITSGVLIGIGDILAQQLVEKRGRQHDVVRTIRMASVGLICTGPALYTWYGFLDRTIRGPAKIVPIMKLITDQILFAPCIVWLFFSATTLLEGSGFKGVKLRLQQDYVGALKMNYVFWPGVQLINFYFIPSNLRVPYVSVAALIWNVYLAWVANKTIVEPNEAA